MSKSVYDIQQEQGRLEDNLPPDERTALVNLDRKERRKLAREIRKAQVARMLPESRGMKVDLRSVIIVSLLSVGVGAYGAQPHGVTDSNGCAAVAADGQGKAQAPEK